MKQNLKFRVQEFLVLFIPSILSSNELFHIPEIATLPVLAQMCMMCISVNSVVEFPGAGSGRLITINSELNGAI